MTGHNRAPGLGLTLGGVPVDQRLTEALPELTARIVSKLLDELPVYRNMPREELHGEVVEAIVHTTRGFISVLRSGELPDAAGLATMRETAARRAEERVPLEAIVAAYHLGTAVCLDYLRAAIGPEDTASVLELAILVTSYLQRTTAAVCGGYLEERQIQVGDEETSRQALLAALLDGNDARAAADRAGVSLPPGYTVLSLAFDAHADESEPGVDPLIAARRKLRRVRVALEQHSGGTLLSQLSAGGGILLLSRQRDDVTLSSAEWAHTNELWRVAERAAGAGIMAGAAAAATSDVAGAAAVASEVRRVAEMVGRPRGVYRLDDLLLEYQLTRPSPALDRLAGALDPLRTHPDLSQTLDVYLALGLDRRSTAQQLHVHPNTVDYRLRRVTELTGLDATKPTSLPTLRAALAARDAAAGAG